MAHLFSTAATPITDRNVDRVVRLQKESEQRRSGAEKLAGTITRVAGGTPFILLHVVWFAAWILANTGFLPGVPRWDPFPFGFLTLVVSLEAIFLSLLVLMAQNRMTQDADRRALLDLQINMLAEQESTATLQMLEKICKHLGITFKPEEETQLAADTDIAELAKTLEEKLTDGQ